jgi:excisionase family DNA binding protein
LRFFAEAMPDEFNPTEWITTSRAAELMGYDYAHVRLLARKGRIKATKMGRDWLVDRTSAVAYAEEMERLGAAKHDPTRDGIRGDRGSG